MNDKMKKEILENWFSWKYDIIDCNRSEWTQRDQAIIETIEQILNDELSNHIESCVLKAEIKRLRKELHDRKTND